MQKEIINLTKQFIEIPSNSDNPKALNQILELALSKLNEFHIKRFEYGGVKSALVYNTPKLPKKFKIILNGHLDVVPGKLDQYHPTNKDDRLFGVGALDMKASLATLIYVYKNVASQVNYPLGLQIVTDEELGGFNGTKHQIQKGVNADFVISGESTNFDIINKAKGIIWLKINFFGKSAHGAYTWIGDNAIWKMHKFLSELSKFYPIPKKEKWASTINLAHVETSNLSFNKVPDNCTIWLDIRFIPDDKEKILQNIKRLLPPKSKIEIIANESSMNVIESNPYIKNLYKTCKQLGLKDASLRGANGSSDARHFANIKCAGVEFGPIGGAIGSEKEWVSLASLTKYFEILKTFLLTY